MIFNLIAALYTLVHLFEFSYEREIHDIDIWSRGELWKCYPQRSIGFSYKSLLIGKFASNVRKDVHWTFYAICTYIKALLFEFQIIKALWRQNCLICYLNFKIHQSSFARHLMSPLAGPSPMISQLDKHVATVEWKRIWAYQSPSCDIDRFATLCSQLQCQLRGTVSLGLCATMPMSRIKSMNIANQKLISVSSCLSSQLIIGLGPAKRRHRTPW